jgi:tRNA (guanine-N7-)-methyltransferase
LNFSDPWPKKGYAKRRLTYRTFLEIYRGLLKKDGILRFKTDNDLLFASSLEEFEAAGLKIEWMTDDLHNSERAATNIMTEYEENFASKGKNIHAADVRFPEKEA